MAKISNLPKATTSSDSDLLTIVQNGITKSISKANLLRFLTTKVSKVSTQVQSTKKQIATETLPKGVTSFNTPLKIKPPVGPTDAATKKYVDTEVSSSIRDLKHTRIRNNLNYTTATRPFIDESLVTKKYVDTSLKDTLKAVTELNGSLYPKASRGDVFISRQYFPKFAVTGPELQEGDLLLCLRDSVGGSEGKTGDKFAIINTNVVTATNKLAGIVRKSTAKEVEELISIDSIISPADLKYVLEKGSSYNRTVISYTGHKLAEYEKGIIEADLKRAALDIYLPAISSLSNSKLVKYIIKDTEGYASQNNLTIYPSSSDTIDQTNSLKLTSNGQAVTLYNNGNNKWSIESTSSGVGGGVGGGGEAAYQTITGPAFQGATTGSDITAFSLDIDLSEYDLNQGFKLVAGGTTGSASEAKTVQIDIDGITTIDSGSVALTSAAWYIEITILNSIKYAVANGSFISPDLDATVQYQSHILSLDNNLWQNSVTAKLVISSASTASNIQADFFYLQKIK